jgi:protein TonB
LAPQSLKGKAPAAAGAKRLSALEGARWGWASAGSLGLHGAAVGACLVSLNLGHAPEPPPPAAIVMDVSLVAASPPVPQRDTPPGPEQEEQRPTPKLVLDKLPFIPALTVPVKAEVVVPLKEEQREEDKPDANRRVEVTTAPTGVPAPTALDATAPTVGRSANPPSNAEQAWEGLVLAQLERNKRYPSEAQRAGMEDAVLVRLTMDRKGKVLDARIRRSKGYGPLDGEVLSLVRRASPLPAPPKEIEDDPVILTVPVEFFIKKRGR